MRVLIVGLGSIGKKHVAALQALNVDADIFALRSKKESDKIPGVTNILSLEELSGAVDFVIISNPTNLHLETIKRFAELKVPLFIEKPLVRHLSEIDEVLAVVQAAGVPTYIGCHMRHHPCLKFLHKRLDPTTVQSAVVYCGSYMPEWVPGRDWKTIFRANEEMSGGVHLELIHEMDYVTWILGMPTSVKSHLERTGTLGVDVVDRAHYDLNFQNASATIDINYLDRIPRRTFDLKLANEIWHVDLLQFTVHSGDQEIFHSNSTIRDVYREQMEYFLNCLAQGIPPMNSVQEAAKVLTLALS